MKKFLLLLIVTLFGCAPARAEFLNDGSLQYCLLRGKLAFNVAKVLADGSSIDRIDLAFSYPAKDEADTIARESWVQELKAEIAQYYAGIPEGEHRAAKAAQKVVEACAYLVGANRMKKTAYVLAGTVNVGEAECRFTRYWVQKAVHARTVKMPEEAWHIDDTGITPEQFEIIKGIKKEAYHDVPKLWKRVERGCVVSFNEARAANKL